MVKKTYRGLQDELNSVLTRLESEDLDVDEALKLYEKGLGLTKELEAYLSDAENKLSELNSES